MRDACEAKPTVAAKHPSRLREKLRNGWLREQIEHIGADDSINAGIRHRNDGSLASRRHGGARGERGQARPRNPHHGRADVHAVVHAALCQPMLQKLQREASRTAAELEHRLGALKIAVRDECVERGRLVEGLAVLPAPESIVERPRLFGRQGSRIGDVLMPNDGDDLGLPAVRSMLFLRRSLPRDAAQMTRIPNSRRRSSSVRPWKDSGGTHGQRFFIRHASITARQILGATRTVAQMLLT
jgi:hypothetical protein